MCAGFVALLSVSAQVSETDAAVAPVGPYPEHATQADGQKHGWDMVERLGELAQPITDATDMPVQETNASENPAYPYLKAVYGALITFALLAAFVYIMHKLRRHSPLLAGGGLAKTLGTFHLTSQASLHFVRIAGKVLVLGVTRENIALVTELDASVLETAPNQTEAQNGDQPAASFEAQLRTRLDALSAGADGKDKDEIERELGSLRDEIGRLRRYLREDAREMD